MSSSRFNRPRLFPQSAPPRPVAQARTDFPALTMAHMRDARLYADRQDLIAALGVPAGGVVAEVGVAFGSFSKVMIDLLHPREFVAVDTFELHKHPMIWGRPTAEVFKGQTHSAFYAAQFEGSGTIMTIREGLSHVRLAEFPNAHFDLIYLDADHSYEAVKADADVAKRKLRRDGVLVFNDYIMFDHVAGAPYGVVPAVNELVVEENWQVVGFGLQHQMFCDIAIRPAAA